jgi:hypothetical protein
MRDRGPQPDETPAEVDRLLRALADRDPSAADGLEAPSDLVLQAYREGRLSAEEERELEDLLARSGEGRRRLVELAGIDRSLPWKRVRRTVLRGLGEAARDRRPRRPRETRRAGRRWATAAAIAGVAAMVVLALLVLLPRPGALPAGLAFDVSARGLATVRGEEMPREVRVHPATAVRIFLRPRGASPAGLSFALFRREDHTLRRVRQPEEVRLASDRGSATFTGAAATVLGHRAPGVYPLYAVVSSDPELPGRVDLTAAEDPVRALSAAGRLVYPLKVILLPDDPATKGGE